MPTSSPVIVSQLGMRRLRQSVTPAATAKATANPNTTGFKRAPPGCGMLQAEPWLAEVVELVSLSMASGLR
jgi:hypothetical protein